MAFELFTQAGGSFAAKVSIRANGQMGLSQGLLRRQGMDKGDWFVRLYYDRETKRVALQPTSDGTAEGAIKVLRRENTGRDGKPSFSAQISGRSFLEFHDIPYKDGTLSYDATWVDADKMFIIDLTKPRDAKEDDL